MSFPHLKAKLAQAPALYATDGKDKKVVATIMLRNSWEYEVYEAEWQDNGPEDGSDILMFCKVHGIETELGYVSFREIEPYILCWSEPSVYFEHAY